MLHYFSSPVRLPRSEMNNLKLHLQFWQYNTLRKDESQSCKLLVHCRLHANFQGSWQDLLCLAYHESPWLEATFSILLISTGQEAVYRLPHITLAYCVHAFTHIVLFKQVMVCIKIELVLTLPAVFMEAIRNLSRKLRSNPPNDNVVMLPWRYCWF